ncbi:MAG: tetratricopeptide repeat protein [bacterium]|nr:tetratricopeptide repeat protein [bacterium]
MPNEEIQALKSKLQALREKDVPPEEIVDTLNDLASAYFRINPELTEKHAKEANDIAEETGYSEGIGRSLKVIGISYWVRGKYDKALDYYLEALTVYQVLGNELDIADISNNIGIIFAERKNFDQALEYFQKALSKYGIVGDKQRVAGIYNNVALIHRELNEYFAALNSFRKSLDIRLELGEESAIADSYDNIGLLYEEQNELEKAADYYVQSLEIREIIGNKLGTATSFMSIGGLYYRLKSYKDALSYYQDALRITNEIGAKNQEMICYQKLSELYEAQNDFGLSLDYYKKFTEIDKELFSEDKNRQLTEIRTKYETDKKEKEAEIYRLKNVELQAAYDKTDELLRNILPGQIVEELEETSIPTPRIVDNVTIVFVDIVDFTLSANENEPEKLLAELASHFGAYDEIVRGYGLEKLKTFGDGYMSAGGLFSDGNQVEACAEAALDILDFVKTREWDVRIGIHIGPCIAGLIKGWRMIYDVWGETVNMAARLEQTDEPGKVNVSQTVNDELADTFNLESRGEIAAHNLGPTPMYFITSKE